MAGSSALPVASLEVGAIIRLTISAMARSRQRLPSGPSRRSRPMCRRVPSTGDVAVWQRADDGQGLLPGRDDAAAVEQGTQALDQMAWPAGQVEQRPLSDLVAVAVAFTQEDRRWRAAVRDDIDIHDPSMAM